MKRKTGAVGIDLGGTFIKAGVVDAQGAVAKLVSRPTEVVKGRDAIVANLAAAAEDAVRAAGATWDAIAGVGLGSPGVFDYAQGGKVLLAPNLGPLQDEPLLTLLERALNRPGLPVVLENDANAAAFGEMWAGAGKGRRDLVLMTLGTGIGGGIVLDGEVWHGRNGFAGELGHQTILPDGPRCGCGNHGCLEVLASVTGLVRRFREAVAAGRPSALAERVRRGEAIEGRDIHEAAVAGDVLAREMIAETGRYLGIAAANMINILNPEVVAFGGGMTASGDMLLIPIREEAARRAIPAAMKVCDIIFAQLGNSAGLIGAAGCAWKASEISAS